MPTAPGAAPGGQQDMMKMIQLAAHHQLGVIEYCKAQVEGLDAAEAAGRKGLVQFGGNEVDIKQAAKAQNTTPDAMCKQIGSMLQAQAANLPK